MFLSIIALILALAIVLVFMFAPCGKKNKGNDTTTAPETITAPETNEEDKDPGANMTWWFSHDTPRKTKKRKLAELKAEHDTPKEKYVKHAAGFNKSQWHMKKYAGWATGRTTVNNDGGRTKIAPKNRIAETHCGFSRQDRLRADRRRERKNRDTYRDSCYEEWI